MSTDLPLYGYSLPCMDTMDAVCLRICPRVNADRRGTCLYMVPSGRDGYGITVVWMWACLCMDTDRCGTHLLWPHLAVRMDWLWLARWYYLCVEWAWNRLCMERTYMHMGLFTCVWLEQTSIVIVWHRLRQQPVICDIPHGYKDISIHGSHVSPRHVYPSALACVLGLDRLLLGLAVFIVLFTLDSVNGTLLFLLRPCCTVLPALCFPLVVMRIPCQQRFTLETSYIALLSGADKYVAYNRPTPVTADRLPCDANLKRWNIGTSPDPQQQRHLHLTILSISVIGRRTAKPNNSPHNMPHGMSHA
jgi:hypothetical protein